MFHYPGCLLPPRSRVLHSTIFHVYFEQVFLVHTCDALTLSPTNVSRNLASRNGSIDQYVRLNTPSCGDDVACLADALLAHADALPTWRRAPLGGIECVGGARAGENIVAFVGARAGSQRVTHKNVKPFAPDGRGLLEIAVGELSAALGGAPESIIFSSDSLSYDQTAARFAGVRAVPRDPQVQDNKSSQTPGIVAAGSGDSIESQSKVAALEARLAEKPTQPTTTWGHSPDPRR